MYGIYWWIIGKVERVRKSDGFSRMQPCILGPYASEAIANENGFRAFDGDFKAVELNTRDKAAATSRCKHLLFDASDNLAEALEPIRHKISGQ